MKSEITSLNCALWIRKHVLNLMVNFTGPMRLKLPTQQRLPLAIVCSALSLNHRKNIWIKSYTNNWDTLCLLLSFYCKFVVTLFYLVIYLTDTENELSLMERNIVYKLCNYSNSSILVWFSLLVSSECIFLYSARMMTKIVKIVWINFCAKTTVAFSLCFWDWSCL